MNVVSFNVNLESVAADHMVIKLCARFVRGRIAETQAAEAWIACGERLANLKSNLVRKSPRADKDRIGWIQAFRLGEFPFGRRHADKLIIIHEFLSGPDGATKKIATRKLPASYKALLLIATTFKKHFDLLEQCIVDGSISPGSTEGEIRALVKKHNLVKPKKRPPPETAPKVDRIARVRKLMRELGLTVKDLDNTIMKHKGLEGKIL